MAKTFSITTPTTETKKADSSGRAEFEFKVNNISGRPARGLAKAKALDSTKQEWLKLQGDDERDFDPGVPQEFIVAFEGPVIAPGSSTEPKAGAAQASTAPEVGPTYSFRLDVAAATNPDEDYTEGPVVKVEAAIGKEKKKFPFWIIPVAAIVLIGIGVGLFFALRDKKVEVPNVVGMQVADATAEIESKGLKAVEGTAQVTGNVPAGQVIEQSPQAGAKAEKDSEVTLTVEGAKPEEVEELVEVPDVVKRLVNDATQRLTDAGFIVVTAGTEVTAGFQPDQVVSQKPGGGEKASVGSQVELTVAAQKLIEVPDVRFNPLSVARQKLTAVGLRAEQSNTALAGSNVAPGSVISHSPPAGRKVPPNSVIKLVIAATPVKVPALVGKRIAEAQVLTQKIGLELVTIGVNPATANFVRIRSQKPAAGTTAAKGSKVFVRF